MRRFFKESVNHLIDTDWTYLQHLKHSIKQSNRLILLALKSYIHGIFPCLFISDGPKGIYLIYKEIKKIHHVQKIFKNL